MTLNQKNALVFSSVLCFALVLFLYPDLALAAGDIESALTSKVDKIIGIATKVGYGLCTLGIIIGAIMAALGNPRGKGIAIAGAVAAVVIAIAGLIVDMMKS